MRFTRAAGLISCFIQFSVIPAYTNDWKDYLKLNNPDVSIPAGTRIIKADKGDF